MTGAQFLDILCGSSTKLGLSDKNSSDTVWRATVLEWLNLVVKDIQNRQQGYHWRWLEKTATASTVADQFYYGMPSDIDTSKIWEVYDKTNDFTYKYIPYELFKKRVADETNNTGTPRFFTYYADQIGLFPVPSSAITFYLDYIQLITALADDSNSCEIPAKYDKVLLDGTLAMIFRFDPTLGDFATQTQVFENGVKRMQEDNEMMITEEIQPESHRVKHFLGNEVDGKNSYLFPLDNTSM